MYISFCEFLACAVLPYNLQMSVFFIFFSVIHEFLVLMVSNPAHYCPSITLTIKRFVKTHLRLLVWLNLVKERVLNMYKNIIKKNFLLVLYVILAIFTPQPLRAVWVLFSPLVSGWAGGWREKVFPGSISETIRCRKLILGRDIG